MSLFSEAPRKIEIGGNSQFPGPASYTPGDREVRTQCAPFNSSASKSLKKSRVKTPGPGDYNLVIEQPKNVVMIQHNQLIISGRERYQSIFCSRTQRFNSQLNPKTITPGPGQYQVLQDRNSARQPKIRRTAQSMIKMSNSKVVVPSIPTDILGYKEAKNGELVKIQPPGTRVVGPGSYQLKSSEKNTALNWSHMKAEEDGRLFTNLSSNSFVGPGAYDIKGKVFQKSKRPGTSSFKSKSEKIIQRADWKNPTPGPGYYEKGQSPFVIVPQQTHFGSKTARFFNKSQTSPGPGTYGLPVKIPYNKNHLRNVPFNTSSKRTESWKSASKLGPGSYNPPKIFHSKATIIGFEDRFLDNRGTKAPGPGAYSPELPSRPKTTAVMYQQSVPLIKKEEQMVPTATSYTVENFSIAKRSVPSTAKSTSYHGQQIVKHPFNSSAERFYKRSSREIADQDQNQLRAAIGKLTQKLVIRQTTYQRPQIPFNSTADRVTFPSSTYAPDPAAYQDAELNNWVKPSFNIKSAATTNRAARK